MEDLLIQFETAKLAKEKGFGVQVYDFYYEESKNSKPILTTGLEYNSDQNILWDWNLNGGESGTLTKVIPYPNSDKGIYTSAPTQSLLQKWLREIHNIHVVPASVQDNDYDRDNYLGIIGYCIDDIYHTNGNILYTDYTTYPTYEEALERGLQEALKLI